MEDLLNQIAQIETLISSNSKEDKSFGYSRLRHLQEQYSEQQPSAIQPLANSLSSLLSSAISDISDNDEEIAAQALKCLGFMIYHPSLVVSVTEEIATLVVQSLVQLIMTTKMKAVCNLGVWCISIQQFNAAFLASHFNSLLRTIIYALDNPIGSLSTTFEAFQALMKLAVQLGEKMRFTSNIWTPLICRRLLSIDKRERDMTERCFMKIRSVIFPPPVSLSKALAMDLKKSLLSEMKEMLHSPGRKLHAIQAWGWFICLLGPHALKNRHLVNEMLKIPEQTFSDSDPKIQIASLSSWKGLIDALIFIPLEDLGTEMALGCGVEPSRAVTVDCCQQKHNQNKADDFSRSVRLIMIPLVGIISSKCEVSVHLACLNTWCYLLHKLDHSVNYSSVVKLVLEPILGVVFQIGPNGKNILLWNSCLDLFDEFVSAKCRDGDHDGKCQDLCHLSAKTSLIAPSHVDKYSSRKYLIKWLPWDLSMLDFHLKMVHALINLKSMKSPSAEFRSLACDAAVRIFRSTLKGVQNAWKKLSISYKEIMRCLNVILHSIKQFFEDLTSREFGIHDFLCMLLNLVDVVRVELEPSLLASPLYKVALDLKYVSDLQLVNDFEYPYAKGMDSINYMDMVSPMLYLTILYLCISSQSISNESQMDIILQGLEQQLKFMLSSYNPLENLCVIISFLYKQRFSWLQIWKVVANCLKEHLDCTKATSLKIELKSDNYLTLCWFLAYPIVVCFCPQKLYSQGNTTSFLDSSLVFSHNGMELELILDVWRLLYGSINCSLQSDRLDMNCFAEDLCSIFLNILKVDTSNHDVGIDEHLKNQNKSTILLLFGEVALCFLKQIFIVDEEVLSSKVDNSNNCGYHIQSSGITKPLEFVSRFMNLSLEIIKSNAQAKISVIVRVFSAMASVVCHLCLKKDILQFMEIIFDPLAQWLSACAVVHGELQEISITRELQLLWAESLICLQRSQPPIIFDSSFLKIQESVLETTLNHPISAISESSIAFWNHTYGVQTKLEYPQSLIPILDRLSRQGRICIHQKISAMYKDHSSIGMISVSQGYKVATTRKMVSKRVEFMEDPKNDLEVSGVQVINSKRKRLELTEHQNEVRRAQRGKERDCNGHGPGFRTYTTVDFSQGNDDSQDSQELRNPESILELLKRF